jgi:death-on-curing family protein
VNSKRGTQFRQWATKRLKDYLLQGYAINKNRLKQKQMEVEYLKTGIRILGRAIEEQSLTSENDMLRIFSKGLKLLDDFDHEKLDIKGKSRKKVKYPAVEEYYSVISSMREELHSGTRSTLFANPKDHGFESAIGQIGQSFAGKELYPTIEEKAATLLYLVVKNHCFVDGNKRIGAACFLYFLQANDMLFSKSGEPVIGNDALAALTLFIASSKPREMESVKRFIISVLNR